MIRPTAVQVRQNYRIWIEFEAGEKGEIDLSHLAGKGVFKAWLDPEFFQEVRIVDNDTILWSDNIDLCPDALYIQLTSKIRGPSLASNAIVEAGLKLAMPLGMLPSDPRRRVIQIRAKEPVESSHGNHNNVPHRAPPNRSRLPRSFRRRIPTRRHSARRGKAMGRRRTRRNGSSLRSENGSHESHRSLVDAAMNLSEETLVAVASTHISWQPKNFTDTSTTTAWNDWERDADRPKVHDLVQRVLALS